MELYELELSNLIEVKIMRINTKKLNDVKTGDPSFNEKPDKYENFILEENTPQNLERIQSYTSGFGKILFCETLEALLYINNLSDREIRIKDVKFKVSNEVLDEYESMFKKFEFYLINSNTPFIIPAGYFMHKRIKILADTMCKYIMEIDIQYGSVYYNDEFLKHSQTKIIKTISNHYYITSNPSNVIAKFFKKFLFSTNLPFKLKDKIICNNMEQAFIEVNLTNPTPYTLQIRDVSLIVDASALKEQNASNKADQLEIVRSDNKFFCPSKSLNQSNAVDLLGLGVNLNSKAQACFVEPEEELNFSFTVLNYKAFISSNAFVFKVSWSKKDEEDIKHINYSLKNKSINDLFTLLLVEKPPSDVIRKDEYFNIILQLINKTQRILKIKISSDKQSDREFEVIDIIEKEFELKDKTNITLICKSDALGNVYLPKLTVYEESLKKTVNYEKLFNFNCVQNQSLLEL